MADQHGTSDLTGDTARAHDRRRGGSDGHVAVYIVIIFACLTAAGVALLAAVARQSFRVSALYILEATAAVLVLGALAAILRRCAKRVRARAMERLEARPDASSNDPPSA